MGDSVKFDQIGTDKEGHEWGFRYDRTVTPELVDRNRHLNYLGFVKIFEEAQIAFQSFRGVGYEDLQKLGITLVVKELNVTYEEEVSPDEQVVVFTKSFPGNTSVPIHQAMINKENKLVARATFAIVALGPDKKPMALPPDVRGKLSSFTVI